MPSYAASISICELLTVTERKDLLFVLLMLKSKVPEPIRPETVDTSSSSSKKSAIIPEATAQFKAIASLGILEQSKLCMYDGRDTLVIGELDSSNLWYASK